VSAAQLDRLHPGEVHTDAGLVRRLIAAQFPDWAGLAVTPVPTSGTDHVMYHLGEERVVRLPRLERAAAQALKEDFWLPRLASCLPLPIPRPLALGAPGEGFPWSWSIYAWLEGEAAATARFDDPVRAAVDLAGFIVALRAIDATEAPGPGRHNFWRGGPLDVRDPATSAALAQLDGVLDTAAAARAWDAALAAPAWAGPPVWIHGDMLPGNLLVADGHLAAVIDFGGLGAGDPACDLMIAWSLFTGEARAAFRQAVVVDDHAWARGRGWALHTALVALPYYRDSKPDFAAAALRTIETILAEDPCRTS
jgi:aminoglycoside phosphotransferase (APT) family kinase protein